MTAVADASQQEESFLDGCPEASSRQVAWQGRGKPLFRSLAWTTLSNHQGITGRGYPCSINWFFGHCSMRRRRPIPTCLLTFKAGRL